LYITAADKESTGWLYAGQASRMAFNLGLHLDCSKHVQQGLITPDDAVIRSVTWWGVYVIDRYVSAVSFSPASVLISG
jgi:hypothetical protein